jgi:antitoxin PrlF
MFLKVGSVKVTVSEKGQVTIPKEIRDRLGIKSGEILDFYEDNGKIVAVKIIQKDPVGAVYGILNISTNTDDLIKELRGDIK